MKSLKLIGLLFAISIFSFSNLSSQTDDHKLVVGLHAGYSLTGAVIKAAEDGVNAGSVDVGGTPALQLSLDYGLTNWFSIGVAGSFQTFGFDFNDYTYVNSDLETITEDATGRTTRSTIALRPLFHYGNKGGKLDMYSGLRIQYVLWSNSFDSTDPNFDIADFDGGRPGVGIVPFGIRYFFTDMLGAGFELMWGAPYIASFNVNARF